MPDTPDEQSAPPARDDRPTAARPVQPGAAAASRARRIGGRPVPGTRPAAGATSASPAADPGQPPADERVEREPELDDPSDAPEAPATAAVSDSSGGPEASDASEPIGVEAPDTDDAAAPAAAAGPVVPTWLNWAPAGVLVAGCVVLAVLLLVFSHGVWWGPDRAARPDAAKVAARRDQVLAAAKSCVVTANQYDYRTLPAYEKRALACTTGAFTAKLKKTIESLIMVNAPKLKAKQTPQINRAAIESVTPDGTQWTLLIFGQLSVVNANFPKGRTDPFGAEVRMDKAHGKWLISDLEVVSSPIPGS